MTVIDSFYSVNPDTGNGIFATVLPSGVITHVWDAAEKELTVPQFGGLTGVSPTDIEPANLKYRAWLRAILAVSRGLSLETPTPPCFDRHVVEEQSVASVFRIAGSPLLRATWGPGSYELKSHNGGVFTIQGVAAWANATAKFIALVKGHPAF